jgi:glycerophosphoryl diester phosphodiesterase
MKNQHQQTWPYPFWIAHRGGGRLAPENTLAAFELAASRYGYRAFECDVQLSRDDVPFLMHDASLQRTTGRAAQAGDLSMAELAVLDAGSWFGQSEFAGEPVPSLQTLITKAIECGWALNLEIKPPTPEVAAHTGHVVAQMVSEAWARVFSTNSSAAPSSNAMVPFVLPLISSFDPEALRAAATAAPHVPRALLLETLQPGWLQTLHELGCTAAVLNEQLLGQALIEQLHAKGLRVGAYTVNDPARAAALKLWGIDSLITDALDELH